MEYEQYLKEHLSNKRFEHCLRTAKMAEYLCELYNIDKIAIKASLLHDIAKELSVDEMLDLITENDKKEVGASFYNSNILHGYAGANLVKKLFDIKDERIITAIKYHTTGKKNMTDIEKVVYISDAIEEGRTYEGVEKIREEVYKSLNKGIRFELKHKLNYLLENNGKIHPFSLDFWNSLVEELNEG